MIILSPHIVLSVLTLLHLHTIIIYIPSVWYHQEKDGFTFLKSGSRQVVFLIGVFPHHVHHLLAHYEYTFSHFGHLLLTEQTEKSKGVKKKKKRRFIDKWFQFSLLRVFIKFPTTMLHKIIN